MRTQLGHNRRETRVPGIPAIHETIVRVKGLGPVAFPIEDLLWSDGINISIRELLYEFLYFCNQTKLVSG